MAATIHICIHKVWYERRIIGNWKRGSALLIIWLTRLQRWCEQGGLEVMLVMLGARGRRADGNVQ